MAAKYDPEINLCDLEENLQDQQEEVVVLESIFADTDRLRVICWPDNTSMSSDEPINTVTHDDVVKHKNKSFVIQIDVKVDIEDKGITVEAWLPCSDDNAKPPTAGSGNAKPQFERTVSGRRWNTSFRLNHLTPLTLEVVLPQSYPGSGPPQMSLSCLWLDRGQLGELCRQLDLMWMESPGMPIIYTWTDWLQHNTLSTLGVETAVPLIATNMQEEMEAGDPRAQTSTHDLEHTIHKMLMYNSTQEFETFKQNIQTCIICFDQKLGSEFFRLADCLHHFCVDCMTSYSEFHVQEGTVRQLVCPEADCKTILPADILQAVLDQEAFERWERLLFQNTLAAMSDIDWCPRCNSPVIREDEDNLRLAHCTVCIYSFCTRCKEPWHQGTKCDETSAQEEQDAELAASKDNAISRKLKRQDVQSLACIRRTTKPCPTCCAPIEKYLGCNKVCCSNCSNFMCWICGSSIIGYEHFGKICQTWSINNYIPQPAPWIRPVPEGLNRLKQHKQDQRNEAHHQLKKCPKCKNNCLKEDRDNHMHCWCCHAHFCFLCVSILQPPITSHYTHGSPCVQHSD